MGVSHSAVARWVKEFEKTGQVKPAGKLDPYAENIVAMIEADPGRSTHALWKNFKETQGLDVAYTSFSHFIAEIGFARDPRKGLFRRIGPA